MLTLADLKAEFELHAVCIACQRMERLDLNVLMAHVSQDCTVADIRTRVRCRQCRKRTHDIRIVYVGVDGKARGFHYRQHNGAPSLRDQSPSSSVPSNVSPNPDTPT